VNKEYIVWQLVFALVTATAAGLVEAEGTWIPYHAALSGPEVPAHYVHLVLSLDPKTAASRRQDVLDGYKACKLGNEMVRAAGEQAGSLAPPPSSASLEKLAASDVEIYYSDGRSATIVTRSDYYINTVDPGKGPSEPRMRSADCSLREHKSKWLYVQTESGVCDVDLLLRRYRSKDCGWAKSAREQVYEKLPLPPAEIEKMRQRDLATRQRNKGANARRQDTMSHATGEKRKIAGQVCEVFDTHNGTFEKCFATPNSSFPIPAAHYAGNHPGLLLQHTWRARGETLTAQEVKLEMGVSEKLFDPPPGVALDSKLRDGDAP
jgi:hypothetical protein